MIRTKAVNRFITTNVMKKVISPLMGMLKIKDELSSVGKHDDMKPDRNIATDFVARKNPKNKE